MGYTVDGQVFAAYKPVSNVGHRPTAGLSAYPHIVKIVADANVGGRCQADLRDVRFALASDPLVALYAERNHGSITGGAATGAFHVNVPSVLSSANMELLMYYGCPTAPAQANPELTYNSGFAAVYHCSQDPSVSQILDSTANVKHGTSQGSMTSGDLVDGKLYKALDFDGTDDAILCPLWTANATTPSISAWVKKASGAVGERMAMHLGRDGTGFGFGINAANRAALVDLQAWVTDAASTTNWELHCLQRDSGGVVRLYVNGGQVATNGTIVRSPLTSSGIGFSPSLRYWSGLVCEVRCCAALSTAWLAYDYGTQNAADGWLTFGAEVVAPTGRARLVVPGPPYVLGRNLLGGLG